MFLQQMSILSGKVMIYFDVTDVVEFSQSNTHPTGIQRVQIQLIKAAIECGANVRCVFHNANKNALCEFSPSPNFFATQDLRQFRRLRGDSISKFFPAKYEIKRYLRPYDNRKFVRGVKKIGVYLAALSSREWLQDMGFTTGRLTSKEDKAPLDEAITEGVQIPDDQPLVFLGAFWESAAVSALAQARRARGGRNFVLIHDIIPLVASHFCGLGQRRNFDVAMRILEGMATDLLSVSEWTARDFKEHFNKGLGDLPIQVMPLAHELPGIERNCRLSSGGDHPLADILASPYVLCVGTIEARKNPVLIVQAWAKLVEQLGDKTPNIVLAGKWGWKLSEFNDVLGSHKEVEPYLKVVSSASDEDLVRLYSEALFTVFPSHYEGWGLPVGEAAWLGKYCIASSQASVPEVVGSLADYIDPTDLDGFVALLTLAISNAAHRAAKEEAIRHAPLRSWHDVANQLIEMVASKDIYVSEIAQNKAAAV